MTKHYSKGLDKRMRWPEIRTQLLHLLEDAPLIRRADQAVEAIAASCQLHLRQRGAGS